MKFLLHRGQGFLVLMLLLAGSLQAEGRVFTNPLTTTDAADPCIVRLGDKLYLYVTGRGKNGGNFPIYEASVDSQTSWTWVANVFDKDTRPAWAQNKYYFWAPETHLVKGQYVCYFSTRAKDGKFVIGTATAPTPKGPFVAQEEPLAVDAKVGLIDATYFRDPITSKSYVLYKEDGNDLNPQQPTGLILLPVSDDGLTSTGSPKEILYNDQPWEGPLVESPSVIYRNGWYYLFFSGDVYTVTGYNVGVARAKSVTGPYTKHTKNPILKSTKRFDGPGHQFLYTLPDGEILMYYHARDFKREPDTKNSRFLMANMISWDGEGWPFFEGGTPTEQWSLPSP